MVDVQFIDESEDVICAYFSGPQDPEYYPHQGLVEEDDPRYKAFLETIIVWA